MYANNFKSHSIHDGTQSPQQNIESVKNFLVKMHFINIANYTKLSEKDCSYKSLDMKYRKKEWEFGESRNRKKQ